MSLSDRICIICGLPMDEWELSEAHMTGIIEEPTDEEREEIRTAPTIPPPVDAT